MERWHIPSVQATGTAVMTVVSADDERGNVLLGTVDRSLTHLTPDEAIKLASALQDAAREVDPEVSTDEDDTERALLDALRAFITAESG